MTTAAPPPREVLPWNRFGEASRELAQLVSGGGWMPDLVIAVARGGLIPAGAIAYALGVKAMGAMNVEFYTGVDQTLPEPLLLPPLLDTSVLAGAKVLVVDDVADSGRTLEMVMRLLRTGSAPATDQHVRAPSEHLPAEARSAVLYTKPRSVIEPDYTWRRTDRWIAFPWSTLPPVTAAATTEA
ncbi:phosphoribosyltransferase [Ruania halotolerans]|uniref:phosphoribosyltransferase n=1 Tax=Ruania halotolerans TaxID=2897773 RepID=UPI001E47C2DA|nr:phosphoribosyltransferase [Ruania halotolerans]UFU06667.1 phosphoribosyltransferase [Ruania halotolerans]